MRHKNFNTKRRVYSARSAHVYSAYITHKERERGGGGGGGGGGQRGGVIKITLEKKIEYQCLPHCLLLVLEACAS